MTQFKGFKTMSEAKSFVENNGMCTMELKGEKNNGI